MHESREQCRQAKKIVLKLGSSVLTGNTQTLKDAVFSRLAGEICKTQKGGRQFVIVSSGAIAAGRSLLKFSQKVLSIPQKQACAAVGQGHLIRKYELAFRKHRKTIAQMLLTHDDLSNRSRYLNAKHTLATLLDYQVIPIINENDSVVVEEIKFGDNDTLSALITPLLEADLLILLTDTDGLYDADPRKNPQAKLLPEISAIDEKILQSAGATAGKLGVGGMVTKVQAAKRAASYGIATVIANGHEKGVLAKILAGNEIGTLFLPEKDQLSSREHWIAHTLHSKGIIEVDEGAMKALLTGGKSLLPKGIVFVSGNFEIGDAVEICGPEKKAFARGLTAYNIKELTQIKGKNTSEIEKILGYKYTDEVIHRDDLVLLGG